MYYILMLVAALWIRPVCAQMDVEILGDEKYPPYSYKEDGKPKGIYVEILESAFKQMPDYVVTIRMVPWKRGLEMVKKGKSPAVFPPYFVMARAAWLDLSVPILEEQVVVFGLAENLSDKVSWSDDFLGSRFGLNTGFSPEALGGAAFAEACREEMINLQEASSRQNLAKLVLKRIDFYLNDRLTNISDFPSLARGITATSNYGHLGYTKEEVGFPYLHRFKAELDSVIVQMQTSGEIAGIVQKHMK